MKDIDELILDHRGAWTRAWAWTWTGAWTEARTWAWTYNNEVIL